MSLIEFQGKGILLLQGLHALGKVRLKVTGVLKLCRVHDRLFDSLVVFENGFCITWRISGRCASPKNQWPNSNEESVHDKPLKKRGTDPRTDVFLPRPDLPRRV